jgi:hypothetical protein
VLLLALAALVSVVGRMHVSDGLGG